MNIIGLSGWKDGTMAVLRLLLLTVMIGIWCMAAMPAMAQGTLPYQPNWFKAYTVTLTNAQTLSVTNPAFSDVIRQQSGESVFLQAVATNTTTATVTAKLDTTPDGTNYTTTAPFQLSVALNSTTPVMNYTNFPATGTPPTLNNARKIALTTLINGHTNSVTVTVWLSRANQ